MAKVDTVFIKGIKGYKDVVFNLGSDCQILVGPNGVGKTTALKILNLVLNGATSDLMCEDFEYIKVEGGDGFCVTIDRVSNDYERRHGRGLRGRIENEIEKEVSRLFDSGDISSELPDEEYIESLSLKIAGVLRRRVSYRPTRELELMIKNEIKSAYMYGEAWHSRRGDDYEKWKESANAHRKVKSSVEAGVIFLPTFRRIEADFISNPILSVHERRELSESVGNINFSMDDIDEKINSVLIEIRERSSNSFGSLASNLINKCISGETRYGSWPLYDNNVIELALNRVGSKIKNEVRDKVISIAKSEDRNHSSYNTLMEVVQNIIEAYEDQKDLDEKLRSFKDVCNKYLSGKRAVYDEALVQFGFYLNDRSSGCERELVAEPEPVEGSKIALSQLSSGEKQILSIFSSLYLGNQEETILIIDEPELSLSIEWQENLIMDILESGKCRCVVAATHSPFIFNDKPFDNDDCVIDFLS